MWFFPQKSSKDYAFVDTNVASNIEYAFQALALDERRGPFTPTIWTAPTHVPKELKQCWFRGVHSDLGGGYPDHELANLSLAWMITQVESNQLIEFNHDTFWKLMKTSAERQAKKRPGLKEMPKLKGWGLGRIHNSMKWYYRLLTIPKIREPRSFTKKQPNASWGRQMLALFSRKPAVPLEHTHECMHSSVGWRRTTDETPCDALSEWTYNQATKSWSKPGVDPLPVDELRGLELELAQRWDDIVSKANEQADGQ